MNSPFELIFILHAKISYFLCMFKLLVQIKKLKTEENNPRHKGKHTNKHEGKTEQREPNRKKTETSFS